MLETLVNPVFRNGIRNLQSSRLLPSIIMPKTMHKTLVLCGPSGSGKSTLIKKLTAEFPTAFGFSVSHTTRSPRPGEVHGSAYHFVTREVMKDMLSKGEFIENAEFSGNMYGTSFAAVESVVSDDSKICILDIDAQGVRQVKVKEEFLQPLYVFINIPSMEVLEERLKSRNTETEESLARRMSAAKAEIEYGTTTGVFDTVIVNDDLDRSYNELKSFILSRISHIIS
ncbi:guanylate kinase isoform X1 [Lepeophtheirus salmonis]|uniref:guanylate kinase n=2 Tax=Lepeophtheirus salmonis TaxID=72036 RepID=C1BUL1_LEPSM|nr:guanylate kinase-like isoform X1 [Lepeophtheirus salmonis]ACO12714.1 Guanylate kinase [Lepeophtheirus salmonis]